MIVCAFRQVTGYPCPGCGLSRATRLAVRGRWSEASRQYPLWPVVWLYIAWCCRYAVDRRPPPAPASQALSLSLVATWFVRLHRAGTR